MCVCLLRPIICASYNGREGLTSFNWRGGGFLKEPNTYSRKLSKEPQENHIQRRRKRGVRFKSSKNLFFISEFLFQLSCNFETNETNHIEIIKFFSSLNFEDRLQLIFSFECVF